MLKKASVTYELKKPTALCVALVFLSIVFVFALICGAYHITCRDVIKILTAHLIPFVKLSAVNKLHNTIIWNIRLPRILLAVAVGVALATSGTVFQGCFRNPLVEPYILGVSAGAAFGAALGIVFPYCGLSIQVSAFIFGSVAVVIAWLMARKQGETPVILLILAGVVMSSVFSSFVGIMKYMAEDAALREIVFWLMGGFYFTTWKDVALIFPIVAVCFAVVCFHGWTLNILSMGDREARSLGVSPEKYKTVLIFLATLMTAVSVSVVGIIAWVGLMMPHATRILIGPDHRYVVPLSALLGAIYLIVCDTMARTLTSAEIPIGIITSIVGAPYLFYLLRMNAGHTTGGTSC